MKTSRGYTGVLLTFLVLCNGACHAKICGSIRVQNSLQYLEQLRECTIITGNLKLVLIERVTENSWQNYTFPNLVEIWEYLLVCWIDYLPSLGQLFPNLRTIRGLDTFKNYALIIYDVRHMKEIGLSSLRRIEHGYVKIGNMELCYYNTIDWKALGTDLKTQNLREGQCKPCAQKCNEKCWSENECQSEKIIETSPKLTDEGKYVDKCPNNKVILQLANECVTINECESIDMKNPWFTYNSSCIHKCPEGYQNRTRTCVKCEGLCRNICTPKEIISTLSSIALYEKCTHINGSMEFRIENQQAVDHLKQYMSNIREIWGFLKITRSSAITALDFLPKLELIRGDDLENKKNSLIVLHNFNLMSLWPIDSNFRLRIAKGSMLFQDNPQLCYEDIEKLNNLTLRMEFTSIEVSKESNGNQRLCHVVNLSVEITPSPTNVTLHWSNIDAENRTYFVYYIEGEDDLQGMCKATTWRGVPANDNSVTLENLKPYTNYSYYFAVTSLNDNTQSKTNISSFMTLSDDPSAPRNVEAFSYNSSTILLTWDVPEDTRGVLKHYVITYFKVPTNDFSLSSRNYCKHPVTNYNEGIPLKEAIPEKLPVKTGIRVNGTCLCPKKKQRDVNLVTSSVPGEEFTVLRFDERIVEILSKTDRNRYQLYNNDSVNNTQDYYLKEQIVSAHQKEASISGLDHFTMYMFYISACNENRTLESQCGEISMVYNRTRRLNIADSISNLIIVKTKTDVILNWSNPVTPNSIIVSYNVEWQGESSLAPACIVPSQLTKEGYHVQLPPGDHKVRIRANTLAGSGYFTKFERFTVENTSNVIDYVLIVCLTSGLVLIVACGLYIYYRYKKKKALEDIHLIQSINPDYWGLGYVEDEWEIDRDDLEIDTSIGKGAFGTVYSGFIKSSKLPCAVKTLNINATEHEIIEFMKEAAIMKAFCNAHHVVKLLGVITRGSLPLVIMELMACGDLKTFLRRSRDSSQTIGCNEMFRMAIEIADGMAFLAAKKYVHRDLAARNCMVAGDHTIKVGDFGMARDIYETDYYRKDSKDTFPVRWMAPESLVNNFFTTDSDVWSYGVVLWEMVTLAEQPYQGLANEQVSQFIIGRGRLKRPSECPDLLYGIMEACWKWHPNKRPQFIDIVAKLESHVSDDFKVMSFYHSAEGKEYRLTSNIRSYNAPPMPANAAAAKKMIAHFCTTDDNIELYPENCPNALINKHQHSLLTHSSDEDNDELPGSNGYASLSNPQR